jgi:hypothetical protein
MLFFCHDLVCVEVAHGAVLSIDNVTNGHIRAQALHSDDSVKSERRAGVVVVDAAIDSCLTRVVSVLPRPEVAVDEEVVQEENGIGWRRGYVSHDGADAVVPVRVRAQLGAVLHVRISRAGVARVDKVGVALCRQGLIDSPRQAVVRVARAGPNVANGIGKALVGVVSMTA